MIITVRPKASWYQKNLSALARRLLSELDKRFTGQLRLFGPNNNLYLPRVVNTETKQHETPMITSVDRVDVDDGAERL